MDSKDRQDEGDSPEPAASAGRPVADVLLELADAERRLLARRLHDEVGQRLTGSALLLRALIDRLESFAPAEAQMATTILASLRETIRGVRRISQGVPAMVCDETDLVRGLDRLVTQSAPALGLHCELEAPPSLELDTPRSVSCLCLIAHHVMFTAADQRRAERMSIRLTRAVDTGTLELEDDGKQDDAHEALDEFSSTLMHARASLLGASLLVDSNARGRRRVVCTFPLDRP